MPLERVGPTLGSAFHVSESDTRNRHDTPDEAFRTNGDIGYAGSVDPALAIGEKPRISCG